MPIKIYYTNNILITIIIPSGHPLRIISLSSSVSLPSPNSHSTRASPLITYALQDSFLSFIASAMAGTKM